MLCDTIHTNDGRLQQVSAEDLLVWGTYIVVHLQLLEGCTRGTQLFSVKLDCQQNFERPGKYPSEPLFRCRTSG